MNTSLFDINKTDQQINLENAAQIKGLQIYFDFISTQEEIELLKNIDNNIWFSDLKRRVQHYGYKYDYKARKIDHSYYIGNIPSWMNFLKERFIEKGIIKFNPDQAIINEYVDDQGIAPHIDCEPCFGDTVISLSLEGRCIFNFQKAANDNQNNKISLFLYPKTLIVMTKEARYNWYHGIPSRKSDYFNGNSHKRKRRVSITFRKVLI